MIYCESCENFFDEDELETAEERHPYGEGYATETYYVCPFCRSTNINDAKKCSRCGEWVPETDVDGWCAVCHEDMYGE